jgi:anti-sigma factor RsiW
MTLYEPMACPQVEELLSDHLEGTLPAPRLAAVEAHLAGCAGCRALREALAEVVETLRAHPVLEPPLGLAERAATAALARDAATPAPVRMLRATPSSVQAIAACIAMLVTGLVLLGASDRGTRAAGRLKRETASMGTYLAEKKDRMVEDVRLLRVVIGAAFGSRLDAVNDRVDDYRKLLERRKAREAEKKSNEAGHVGEAQRFAAGFPNRDGEALVDSD